MRSILTRGSMVTILMLSLAGTSAAREGAVGVTLKEAIRSAAEKNLDVKAELYNPAMSEADVQNYRGIYDPLFALDTNKLNYGESSSPGQSSIDKTKNFNFNTGISRLMPWGGTVGLVFANGWAKTGATIPGFQNKLGVTIIQPLLKNFGQDTTELKISVAQSDKDALLEQYRTKVTDIVSQVRTEYFKLYNLREDLEVKKNSLELARKVLDETRARVKAGVLPAMEILSAEATVATRESDVINAERLMRDESDLLRTLLQLKGSELIDPLDKPAISALQLNEETSIWRALQLRPEMKQLRENLRSADLQERVARHQVKPDLSLNANAGLSGINQLYGRQWESLARGDYPVWSLGLTFNYPLGNSSAENDYLKYKLKAEQLRTQIRSKEEAITNEVRSSIRAVNSGYKQIEVTKRGSAYAEENLNAYIKKAAVGLATTKDVFDVQNNLVAAKGAEITARTGYDAALTQYWKSTSELLDREGIKITGQEADALYTKMR